MKSQRNESIKNFFSDKKAVNIFEIEMYQYISIVAPLARSLWSLESATANASDVYIFWLAIAATLKDLFITSRDKLSLEEELISSITKIINRRWRAFIDCSPTDIYFTAFYLDPRKSPSIFKSK